MEKHNRRTGDFDIPAGIVSVVYALIADYERRERVIRYMSYSETVINRYREINAAIRDASEGIEVGLRASIIRDITVRRGYSRSEAQIMVCKNTYYLRRKQLVHDVAVNLRLV